MRFLIMQNNDHSIIELDENMIIGVYLTDVDKEHINNMSEKDHVYVCYHGIDQKYALRTAKRFAKGHEPLYQCAKCHRWFNQHNLWLGHVDNNARYICDKCNEHT